MDMKKSGTRQMIFIILCCLVYSFAYAGRYSYQANISLIMEDFGVTRAEAGLVGTFFFFTYGSGQLLNGLFCKYYNKRRIIPGALFLSSVLNLVMFFQPPFAVIKYLWLINGIAQSLLWPTLILSQSESLDEGMLKKAVLAMSASVLLGTLLAYGGGALFSFVGFYRAAFLFAPALMIGIGVCWFFSYPKLTKKEPTEETVKAEVGQGSGKTIKAIAGALFSVILVSCLFAIVDNFVKDGMNTWMPVILKEAYGFGDSFSIVLTLVLPVFGVFGSTIALLLNKRIKDFRAIMGILYFLMSLCIFGVIISIKNENTLILFLICQGAVSCLAHSVNAVLTSMMPFAYREKINSGFLSGLLNAFCYVGSTLSAYGFGKIADGMGWNQVMLVLLFVVLGAAVIAGVVLLLERIKWKKRKTIRPL